VKKYLPDFRGLANCRAAARFRPLRRFDTETCTARHPLRAAPRRGGTGTQKLVVQTFVEWELAVAYCCGQTGGSRVNAPEITDHFFVQPLWTGELDV
jgi:hypothetical protein